MRRETESISGMDERDNKHLLETANNIAHPVTIDTR